MTAFWSNHTKDDDKANIRQDALIVAFCFKLKKPIRIHHKLSTLPVYREVFSISYRLLWSGRSVMEATTDLLTSVLHRLAMLCLIHSSWSRLGLVHNGRARRSRFKLNL